MNQNDINIEKKIHSILRKNNHEISDTVASDISELVNSHTIYLDWLKHIPGVDVLSAAFLLSELDLSNVKYLSQIYNYTGLNNSNNFNNKLYKRMIVISNYMIKKKSPYSLYYYNKYNKIKNKPDSLKSINSKIYMMKKFLKDLTVVYKLINKDESINKNFKEFDPKLGFTLVNYKDFIYTKTDTNVNVQWKNSKLIKYRYRLRSFEK